MLKLKQQLIKSWFPTNWLSRRSKKFDEWVHEEDYRLRRFTNIRRIRVCVLEHIRKRKDAMRELE